MPTSLAGRLWRSGSVRHIRPVAAGVKRALRPYASDCRPSWETAVGTETARRGFPAAVPVRIERLQIRSAIACAPGFDTSVSDLPRRMCSRQQVTTCPERYSTYAFANDCGNCCRFVEQTLRREKRESHRCFRYCFKLAGITPYQVQRGTNHEIFGIPAGPAAPEIGDAPLLACSARTAPGWFVTGHC